MIWTDIASIVFVCVTANHLGLIGEIERVMGIRLPILNCPKCASFWLSTVYTVWESGFLGIPQIPTMLAVSFAASYLALWLELAEGYIDTLYVKLYEKIYGTTADTSATDAEQGNTRGTVS